MNAGAHDLLSEYALGTLEPAEAAEVEAGLALVAAIRAKLPPRAELNTAAWDRLIQERALAWRIEFVEVEEIDRSYEGRLKKRKPPPKEPECRSTAGPRRVISASASPRIATTALGTSGAAIPVSLTTTTSQASRSRCSRGGSGSTPTSTPSSPPTSRPRRPAPATSSRRR